MAELGRIEKVSHLRIFTRRIKIRKFMISCLPPTVYAVQPTGNESAERLPFPKEIDIIRSANSLPQPVVSMRCSRITERYKLMNNGHILMTTKPKMKNIWSLSRERVLPDPVELFAHLCASTCDFK